jgi:asparagine synthetase B (glutamine-hydrolysing)
MCSFLFSTKIKYNNIDDLNFYLKFRGPDYTHQNTFNNHLFIHNLLSLTGKFTKQPFVKDDIVLLYNGEIYNHNEFGDYDSDGQCLIPLYEKYGDDFVKKIDGEFAIFLIDYKNNKIIISSDIFKTKPLFFAIEKNDIGVSTYKTPLEKLGFRSIPAEPNTTYIICLKTNLLKKMNIVIKLLKIFG